MRAQAVAGSLVFLVLAGLFIRTVGPGLAPQEDEPVAAVPSAATGEETEPPAPSEPVEVAPGRQVAPSVVAPFATSDEPYERIAPRGPLGSLGTPEDPSEGPPEKTLLHRPVAIEAGIVESRGYRIRLEGIEIVPGGEQCDPDSRTWPCGVYARTAFRNFMRGRAIACVVPRTPPQETLVRRCTIGGVDPAEWLVANGWALAEEGSGYEDEEAAARQAGLGVHGGHPRFKDR